MRTVNDVAERLERRRADDAARYITRQPPRTPAPPLWALVGVVLMLMSAAIVLAVLAWAWVI